MKSRISCEFFRNFLLRIFNISQKIAKFDIESDTQKSSFSSKLDKNNWTRKIGLSHPGLSEEDGGRKHEMIKRRGMKFLGMMDLIFVYFFFKSGHLVKKNLS